MAIVGKRIYELDEQVELTDSDVIGVDKDGNEEAKQSPLTSLFNYVKTKLGFGSLDAKKYHKLYVKAGETGFELKGNQEDYAVVTEDELDDLRVEVSKVDGSEIVANAMTSVSGLTALAIRNTPLGTPETGAKIAYYDENGLSTIELSSIGGDGYDYIEVPITSNQIKSMGTAPKNILPNAIGESPYYDVQKCLIEFNNDIPYASTGDIKISNGFDEIIIDKMFITLGVSSVITLNSLTGISNGKLTPSLGRAFQITTSNGANPTTGTGTMLFKIWYKVRNFGTEL